MAALSSDSTRQIAGSVACFSQGEAFDSISRTTHQLSLGLDYLKNCQLSYSKTFSLELGMIRAGVAGGSWAIRGRWSRHV